MVSIRDFFNQWVRNTRTCQESKTEDGVVYPTVHCDNEVKTSVVNLTVSFDHKQYEQYKQQKVEG